MSERMFTPLGVLENYSLPDAGRRGTEYRLTLAFGKDEQKSSEFIRLRNSILETALARWGDLVEKAVRNKKLVRPSFKQDAQSRVRITLRSEIEPVILDGKLQDVHHSWLKLGCLARATFDVRTDLREDEYLEVWLELGNVQVLTHKGP